MTATRRSDGSWEYMKAGTNYGSHDHLQLSLSNIGLFTALDINASMISRGRVVVKELQGKEIEKDPALNLFSKPNFSQSQQDFLYQHQWFKSLGTNVTRIHKKSLRSSLDEVANIAAIENLIPTEINYHKLNKQRKLALSKKEQNRIKDLYIKYTIGSEEIEIPMSELLFFYDITNGLTKDSTYSSPSRIEALRPALYNLQEAQDAENINLNFSGKFIASNRQVDGAAGSLNLRPDEKEEIEQRIFTKKIMATNAVIDVKSLANDFNKLLYNDTIAAKALHICNAYGINRDVLNWSLNGSTTYDNQEKGVINWMQNTIQPQAEDWGNTWTNRFGYREQGKVITLDFSHIPIMQYIEKEETANLKLKAEIIKTLYDSGIDPLTAAELVGVEGLEARENGGKETEEEKANRLRIAK